MFLTGENDVVVRFQPGGTDMQKKRLDKVCADLRKFSVIRAERGLSAGHWIQQERKDEVNAEIHEFLRDIEADFAKAPGAPVMSSKL